MNHEILTMPEIVQRMARTGGKVYVMGPWGRWELDGFWNEKKCFDYYAAHYDDRFEMIAGNMDYISVIRKEN